jgi:predicted DNA-binding protein
MKKKRATFTIDENLLSELEDYSRELDTKKSHIIESSLTAFFDYLDVKIAEKRLADIETGPSQVVPAQDVWKELELD